MILLVDIGNTHTHLGLGDQARVARGADLKTALLSEGKAGPAIRRFIGSRPIAGCAFVSVVPAANRRLRAELKRLGITPWALTCRSLRGVRIDYPRPSTIGQDRLANAVAAWTMAGGPAVVVDFGTAVTFDVVNARGAYIGGVIAPGLSAMTDYLHEKTALLPRLKMQTPRRAVGRSTKEAMLAGAVIGYRGLVREILAAVTRELAPEKPMVIATGGYAALIAREVEAIQRIIPRLTLEGIRLAWLRRGEPPPFA